jgi:hypothetical protein
MISANSSGAIAAYNLRKNDVKNRVHFRQRTGNDRFGTPLPRIQQFYFLGEYVYRRAALFGLDVVYGIGSPRQVKPKRANIAKLAKATKAAKNVAAEAAPEDTRLG